MHDDMTENAATTGIDAEFTRAGLVENTPTSPKRANRRGEQTRDKIVAAATECFTEYGYTRTRISDITHRADTAQGNFYRHFTGLDDVFLAALRPALADLSNSRGRPDRAHGELDSLIEVNTTYLQTYSRHRHMLRLLREAAAASANEGFQQLWLNLRSDYVARTQRWLERLAASDVIENRDFELLAETLGCMTEQLAYVHIGLPASTPKRERIDELGRILGEVWYQTLPFRTTT
ncbi:TetR/AcrR family transcriptional regulator [Rhodococcus sp. 06-621-2]|nr:TetR/AcrR family transcriptional regulator [Rhodococcus sp. 06-621-2]OZC84370.1 TetR/AcrR family transcriptional regulator [Rhodococcus sp. 06-418-1B]